MNSVRTFVACNLPTAARENVQDLLARLQDLAPEIRWVRPEQLHLTVKFLGDIDNRQLPEACNIVRETCALASTSLLSLSGLGTFPVGKPPRVVWLGVDAGSGVLTELHRQLDDSLAILGVPQEGRRYNPHLTLGRVPRGTESNSLLELIERPDLFSSTEFPLEEVQVVASLKERGRYEYQIVDRIRLKDQPKSN